MGLNAGPIILVIGILVLLVGAGMPSQQTVTSTACTSGEFTGDTCYEGKVSAPNPGKDAALGIGGILFFVGLVASVAGLGGGGNTGGKNVGGGNASYVKKTAGTVAPVYRLDVHGDVIDTDTNKETTLFTQVETDDTEDAAAQFKQMALDQGYVLKGDPEVNVASTSKSGGNASANTGSKRDVTGADTGVAEDIPTAGTEDGNDADGVPFGDTSITALIVDTLDPVDSRVWDLGLKAGVGTWAINYLLPNTWIPVPILFGILLFITWALLPVAVYMDARRTRQETKWQSRATVLSLLALVPIVNVLVGGFYLLRRYYAREEREFSAGIVLQDFKNHCARMASVVSDGFRNSG